MAFIPSRGAASCAFWPPRATRPYGRAQELEADRLGLFMMADAGYDPHAAADLWRRMDRFGSGAPAILSTHPAPQARIEAIEALIPEVLDAAVS